MPNNPNEQNTQTEDKPETHQSPNQERTIEHVTEEHNNLCFRAGMLHYRMKVEQIEIDQIFQKLLELNQEAAKLNEIKEKAAKLAAVPQTKGE
jgi:hypothetical protein